MATDFELKAIEQEVHSPKDVQNGNPGSDHPIANQGIVGNHGRPEGCLPAYPHPSRASKVPCFPLRTHKLQVPDTAVRTLDSPEGLHKGNKIDRSLPKAKRNSNICLHRRLADRSGIRGRGQKKHNHYCFPPRRARLDNKQGKIQPHPTAGPSLPGSPSRSTIGRGLSFRGKDRQNEQSGVQPPGGASGSGSVMASTPGNDGEPRGCVKTMQAPHEAGPNVPAGPLQAGNRSTNEVSPTSPSCTTIPSLVGDEVEPRHREEIQRPSAPNECHHGRVNGGLGRNMAEPDNQREVVSSGDATSHQRAGNDGSTQGYFPLGFVPSPPQRHSPIGQHHHGGVHQSPRRYQVANTSRQDLGPSPLMRETADKSTSFSPLRQGEHGRGRPVQRNVQNDGVVSLPTLGRGDLQDVRETLHRPFCLSGQFPSPNVLHETIPSSSMEGRCIQFSVDGPIPLCLPTMVPHCQSTDNAEDSNFNNDSGGPVLAESTVVPTATGPPVRPTVQVSDTQQQPAHTEERVDPPQRATSSTSICVETIKQQLRSQGISSEVAEVAADSRRQSTIRMYDFRLERFFRWAATNSLNPLEASTQQVADFLLHLFLLKRQVSTIKNYRSAIAAVHKGFPDGSTVSNNPVILQLLKGFFNRRPVTKKLPPSWSINDVLSRLAAPPFEPLHNAPLELLTRKTLFLVAAASARRRGCLQALSVKEGFLRIDPDGIRLLPDPQFLAKNQSLTFTPQEIFLPSLSIGSSVAEDKKCCPVRAIKWYLERTKPIRKSDGLFLLPRSPYTPASRMTISRWIVDLIRPHIQPGESLRAHDLRGHATSKAWFASVSLEDIMRAAAWKTPSSFVSHYLTNTISAEGTFARTVLSTTSHRIQNPPP